MIALLFAAIFSVPQLSHASVTRLVQHYLKDLPPEVLLDDAHRRTVLDDDLVASGLFAMDSATGSCGEPLVSLHLTPLGYQIASARGWHVGFDGYEVRIPVGSFQLINESLTYSKQPGLPGAIRFNYWFRENANVRFLLSLAPASAWGSVGMYDGAGVRLNQANKLNAATLPVIWDGSRNDGWIIDKPIFGPGPPQC